ncbi:serine/threonine-protein kinase vrk1 [Plakobranchus ocellatus]|uniref:non-specific serine/threonine protein kinase n=1 Tax=Plakobranchus ocellatus TaxID=259542 RepID=A0AAV4AYU8_9GAST|nr:serine/threonine-protein kinase vrk1 [Plakobranchus ocellatus]
MPGPKVAGRGPKAHKLAEVFPAGMVLQDLCKQRWQLSSVIGQGGFGLIYLASKETSDQVNKKVADHVVKIEPKDNGPLFCEMHFYQRAAKPQLIQSFITAHKLRYLSVPPYISTGRETFNHKEYRFLVMPRFGTDLQKLLEQNGGHFPAKTTFGVGLRMLDALEFLHENEYVHADIKAANILTGFSSGTENGNEVYLVDYGLAFRYYADGVHKEYKEDPRKAHDGTIEFTSRDAHKGVSPSRRGDLEILGYCMLRWLCGKLPWEDKLSDPRYVADSKERLTANPQMLIAACLCGPRTPSLECMCKYMEKVNQLKYDSKPDYKGLRDLLRTAGLKAGLKDEWKLGLGKPAAKVGDTGLGERDGLGITGEDGERGEIPVVPYQHLEENESGLCPAEGGPAREVIVVGQLGRLEELLAKTLHQLGSDLRGQENLLSELLVSLVVFMAGKNSSKLNFVAVGLLLFASLKCERKTILIVLDSSKLNFGAATKRKSDEGGSPAQPKRKKESENRTKSPAPKAAKASAAKSPKAFASPKQKSQASKASAAKSPKTLKTSPKQKLQPKNARKSPVALPVPSKPAKRSPLSNGAAKTSRKKKEFQMPPPTKPDVARASTSPKKSTTRRVRRVVAVQSNMSVQTSPGLLQNR